MSFDTTKRFFAFSSEILELAESLRGGFGELASTAPDHNGEEIKTLLCGLDNKDTGKLRALVLGVSAVPIILSDGRLCLGGYWADGVVEAFENGSIDGEELTSDQVKSLQPQLEI